MFQIATHLLALGLGLYYAWYVVPMAPLWVTKIKTTVERWIKK